MALVLRSWAYIGMLGQALARHVKDGIDRDAKKSYHLLSTNYTGIEILRT